MKKLILVLAILVVAAPAFAALDINLVLHDSNKIDIRYTGADPCNLPRAFALIIDVNSTAVITAVSGYKTGESTSTNRGYGIYPATIAIEPNGSVYPGNWGTPIASDSDPLPAGADQVLPSKNIVLEFGSLYAPVHDGTNSPAVDGNLATLTVECNSASGSVNVRMVGETTYRGGVVLENGTTFAVSKSLAYTCGSDCYKSTSPSYAAWVTFGKPNCWCFQRQCRGDADGLKAGLYWVYTVDLNTLKAAYGKNDATLQTITVGTVKGICADFDHTKTGLYRVYTSDLNILKSYYGKGASAVPVCDANLVTTWKN